MNSDSQTTNPVSNGNPIAKLEIDVMNINEIEDASHTAHKYRLPAIVVHQNLMTEALLARGKKQAKYKILTPIDWPKGLQFGSNKFCGIPTDALEADGYEVMLTGRDENGTRTEVREIIEFIKKRIGETTEVRFILGTSFREDTSSMVAGLLKCPLPTLLRNDTVTKIQVVRANPELHCKLIAAVKAVISIPMKISGNVNDLRAIDGCPGAFRFGVTIQQAKAIIKSVR